MNVSVDISMYPLNQDYKPKILAFLTHLQDSDSSIEIRTSNMSTRVFGDFDAVTKLINRSMKASMQDIGKVVFVCKYLKGDARTLKNFD